MDEFDLIARYFAEFPTDHTVVEGIGDDAAVLRPPPEQFLVMTTDTLIAGVHFPPDEQPASVAHKVLHANLSDIAAMAATPLWTTLALSMPEVDTDWLDAFTVELKNQCRHHKVSLIGGDTTQGKLVLTLTLIGSINADSVSLRRGARPGDDLYFSGDAGSAAVGHHLWQGGDLELSDSERAQCEQRYHRPTARLALGQALGGIASAMLDCSDGLLADLSHLTQASAVKAVVNLEQIPSIGFVRQCQLADRLGWITWGDDYELIFTAPREQRESVEQIARECTTQVTRIGTITDGEGIDLLDSTGQSVEHKQGGYRHFQQAN